MSLFSSLYTGASGMNAQSKSTAMISDNIANLTTVGYKRSEAAFYDLVADKINGSAFASGGTTASRILRASQQGGIQQTGIKLDAAISGNGFFPVRDTWDTASDSPFLYTRNGQFGEFATGNGNESYLRNSAGFFVYGWQLDPYGNLPANTGVGSLVPVQISPVADEILVPTTVASFAANLDAEETPIDQYLRAAGYQTLPVSEQSLVDDNGNANTADNFVVDGSEDAHYVRTFNVYSGVADPAGNNTRPLTVEFRKIVGPMAHFTSGTATPLNYSDVLVDNANGPTPGIANGDTLQISGGAAVLNVTFVNGAPAAPAEANTVADLIDAINASADYTAYLSDSGRLVVQAADPEVTLNIGGSSASVLNAGGLDVVPDDETPANFTYEPESAAYPDQALFPPLGQASNPRHWWEMRILREPDPAISEPEIFDATTGSMIPNPNYNPDDPLFGRQVEIVKGLINFNADGTINVPRDVDGNVTDGILALPTIDFDSSLAGEELDISMDIGGMTQRAGSYNALVSEQNGAPVGHRVGTEIGSDGTVTATYSNGLTADLYRIPLATFINADGLKDLNGTVYTETDASGGVALNLTGEGGAGTITPASIENANVDLGDEFGKLIVAQRSYGASSQIIKTANEMTQLLAQLRR